MSGFQVCSKLKKDPATRDIPIVMVTALNEVADVERAVECGADDFVTKPVNKLELVTRVRSLLRVALLQRRLRKTIAELRRIDPTAGGTI
jgi:two-component system cell cycle response regulator